jgi:hypothetical protein
VTPADNAAATPMALMLRAYFDGRALCLKADPPCAIRPCERHHIEACHANGATTCPACDGLDLISLGMEPCEVCDGYGFCWVFPVSALASSSSGAVRRSAGGDDGGPGRAPGPPSGQAGTSTPNKNRRERELPAAYRPNDLGQNGR